MTESQEKSVTTLRSAVDKSVIKTENQDARETLFSLLKHVHANSPHEAAGLTEDVPLPPPYLVVVTVEFTLKKARENNWPLVRYLDGYYIYCGTHWKKLTDDDLKDFLGKCAEQIKVDRLMCRHFKFKDALLKQFFVEGYFNPPKPDQLIKINLGNGTFHISKDSQTLQPFDPDDFMQYKLSFGYDPSADCPKFNAYLNRVLPDKKKQTVLAEFIAYAFTKNSALKLEKAAILFGSGANGKSVFFDVILKLLGDDNVSNISLQALTDSKGYHRALLPGKLLNYASEISGNLDPTIFKLLVSGEPVEARQIYGKPFMLQDMQE